MENKIDDLLKQLFKTQESDGEFCIMGYNFTVTSEARKIIMNWLQANRHEVLVMRFLAEVNEELYPIAKVKIDDRFDKQQIIYTVELRPTKYIDGGMMNFTNAYTETITSIGKKYFNCEPDFNNTGTTFWFIS
jgi:hypothetical protein